MKAFRTIASVLLAFLVLVSSTSFTVGLHICKGEVQNVALFGHADSCQKEKSLPACHKHKKPNCCQDEIIFHKATDLKASAEHIHVAAPTLINIEHPFVLLSHIIPTVEGSRVERYNYDPPLPSYDLTVSLQVFLI